MRVAFAKSVRDRCIAGSPARRRGNVLLRGQKKVTKEEALNRTPAPHAQAAPCNGRSANGQTRAAALSLLSLSPASLIAAVGRLTRGCTPCSREMQRRRRWGDAPVDAARRSRRPSDAALGCSGEHGVQPRVNGHEGAILGARHRDSRESAAGRVWARPDSSIASATSRSSADCIWRLFFGDFLLAPQKKVTRPPGRTPGTSLASNQAPLRRL